MQSGTKWELHFQSAFSLPPLPVRSSSSRGKVVDARNGKKEPGDSIHEEITVWKQSLKKEAIASCFVHHSTDLC